MPTHNNPMQCVECGEAVQEDPDGSPGVLVHDRDLDNAYDLDENHVPFIEEDLPDCEKDSGTDKTFGEYVTRFASHPIAGLREGQRAFNLLVVMHPTLAEKVRGSMIDPFYQDERLPAFFEFVAAEWDET